MLTTTFALAQEVVEETLSLVAAADTECQRERADVLLQALLVKLREHLV
jgi:hypothetical protein